MILDVGPLYDLQICYRECTGALLQLQSTPGSYYFACSLSTTEVGRPFSDLVQSFHKLFRIKTIFVIQLR